MIDQMSGDAPAIRKTQAKTKKKVTSRGNTRRPRIEPQGAIVHAEAAVRRNAPRPPSRSEGARDTSRETPRAGAVVVMGRTGEVLTRRRTAVGDKFDVPLNEIPAGWSYQWNAVTVLGQGIEEIIRGDLQMHENGWRPVPASRHPGRWAPHGFEGAIIIDGQRLEERPASLTKEAKDEDELRAKSQVRDRTDALRLTQKALPGSDVSRNRGQAGGMKMSIDPALDIPFPEHEIEE